MIKRNHTTPGNSILDYLIESLGNFGKRIICKASYYTSATAICFISCEEVVLKNHAQSMIHRQMKFLNFVGLPFVYPYTGSTYL